MRPGSVLDHFWLKQKSDARAIFSGRFWGCSGVVLGVFWGCSGVVLGGVLEHSGDVLEHSGDALGHSGRRSGANG